MRALSRVSPVILVCILAAAWLAGCASPKAEQFRNSFLPPAPKVAAVDPWTAPPDLSSKHIASRETPAVLTAVAQEPPKWTRFDGRLRKAEELFQEGKRLYAVGDKQGARKQFDAAVDHMVTSPDSVTGKLRLDKRFEDLVDQIYRYDVEGLGAGDDQQAFGFEKAPIDDIIEMTFPIDPKLKNQLLAEVAATTTQLPLTVNDDVLRFVNYFSSERGRRTLLYGLRRAGKFKPMIQRILDEEGVPQELIYLAQAESGFAPRALSNKQAAGMWQFVQYRGREYGLNQSAYFDERLDPEKATRAAARHLRDLYNQMGDWYLALASYNCGPGCVDRAVQRTGYADFWELRSRGALPLETTNYVPIILAMTILSKNAKEHGLDDIDPDPPLEYETVKLSSNANIELIATAADRPVGEIRELNPSLLKNIVPGNYDVHLPKGSSKAVLAVLEAVPADKREIWRVHRVQTGETMADIAKRYGMSADQIVAVNIDGDETLEPGGLLVVPTAAPKPKPAVRKTPVRRSSASASKAVPQRSAASKTTRAKVAAPAAKKPAAKSTAYKTAVLRGKSAAR